MLKSDLNRGYDSQELFRKDSEIRLLQLGAKIQEQVNKIKDLLAKLKKQDD